MSGELTTFIVSPKSKYAFAATILFFRFANSKMTLQSNVRMWEMSAFKNSLD